MPKKAKPESQSEQSARFRAEVQRLVAAGELNPTEAEQAFERLVGQVVNPPLASGQVQP